MIFERIETAACNPLLAGNEVIQEALEFAKNATFDAAPVVIELRGDDLYAIVEERKTLPRAERSTVELHREHVDLQYCWGGGELIDWYSSSGLKPAGEYSQKKDYQIFERPSVEPLTLTMRPGTFALFFPGDAHAPAIQDGTNASCQIIVFKIRLELLAG